MSTKPQFKMYLDADLIEKMENAAAKHGRRSAQQVAEEVIAIYLPVWMSVTDATRRAVDYQSVHVETEPKHGTPQTLSDLVIDLEQHLGVENLHFFNLEDYRDATPEQLQNVYDDVKKMVEKSTKRNVLPHRTSGKITVDASDKQAN